ncbi:MAG: alpha/beta hydrolase [bacterium]|nr:alpha/beta hydrolase [bacterium]
MRSGDPKNKTVVFLHGWGARAGGYLGQENVIRELAKYYYVIAPEHPGLIRSDPPNKVWTMTDFVDNLHTLLSKLDVNNFILMGQSFGGGIATEYAGTYPNTITNLVLIDSIYSPRIHNWYFKLRFGWQPIYKWILTSQLAPTFLKKFAISGYLGVPWSNISRKNAGKWIHMASTNIQSPVTINYTSLSMPVILIWGNKDTFMTAIDGAKKLAEKIPHSKFFEVTGGHTFLYNNPKRAVDILKNEL